MKFAAASISLVATLGTAGVLVSCGSPPVTAEALGTRPEAHLLYPGSNLISTSRQDEHLSAGGTYPGMLTQSFFANASLDEIYGWYVSQLDAKGWTLQQKERVNGSYDLFTRGDREVFQVGAGAPPATYVTRLSVVPEPCASTPPTVAAFVNCG
jgi:hypothetical protein